MYVNIYTHLYECVFNFAAEKRTLDSRCTTLAWTSCLDIRSCCNNNFFNLFRPFLSFSLSMSPLKLSMHSTQTLPCGRLPSVMRNSRVGQRQGVVHQHVPFKFSAPSIVAEDALCRFWSLLGHLVALTMLEAKSVFCIRRFCFSVLLLAMLPWHQYTNKVPLCQISVYVCLCLCLVCICKKTFPHIFVVYWIRCTFRQSCHGLGTKPTQPPTAVLTTRFSNQFLSGRTASSQEHSPAWGSSPSFGSISTRLGVGTSGQSGETRVAGYRGWLKSRMWWSAMGGMAGAPILSSRSQEILRHLETMSKRRTAKKPWVTSRLTRSGPSTLEILWRFGTPKRMISSGMRAPCCISPAREKLQPQKSRSMLSAMLDRRFRSTSMSIACNGGTWQSFPSRPFTKLSRLCPKRLIKPSPLHRGRKKKGAGPCCASLWKWRWAADSLDLVLLRKRCLS